MEEKKYKDPSISALRVIYIVASFFLGLLDMALLHVALHNITPLSNGMAMLVSFFVASAANFIALTWGWNNGKNKAEKTINRKTIGEFLAWAAIGIMYAVIRIMNIVALINEGVNWLGELVQIIILAISYIGTGKLISESAREIWDADSVEYRKTSKEFNRAHDELAENAAILSSSIGIMERYGSNYKSLDNQRDKISRAITKAETATMANIVGKMVTRNPAISSVAANKVMEQVVSDNKEHALS